MQLLFPSSLLYLLISRTPVRLFLIQSEPIRPSLILSNEWCCCRPFRPLRCWLRQVSAKDMERRTPAWRRKWILLRLAISIVFACLGLRRPAKEGECGTSCRVDVTFRVTQPQGRQGAGQQAGGCDCRSDQSFAMEPRAWTVPRVITLRDVYLKFTCVWDGHPDGDWSGGCCHSRALMRLSDLFPTPT